MNQESPKLDDKALVDLTARINRAQPKPVEETDPTGQRNAGYDFVGAILGSMILGWLIDHFCGTSPWGIVGGVILGFGVGIMNVWRSLQGSSEPKNKE